MYSVSDMEQASFIDGPSCWYSMVSLFTTFHRPAYTRSWSGSQAYDGSQGRRDWDPVTAFTATCAQFSHPNIGASENNPHFSF